jgi:hypothetical protein
MPIEYVTLAFNGDHRDANPIKVLTNKIIKLENLQNDKYKQKTLLGIDSGIVLYGINKNIQKRNSSLEIMYFSSQKDRKHIIGNLPRSGLVHT